MALPKHRDEEARPGLSSSPSTRPRLRDCLKSKTLQTWLAIVVVASVALALFGGTDKGRTTVRNVRAHVSASSTAVAASYHGHDISRTRHPLKHLLIPASNPSPDLCKLLLTAAALSYPQPHLLAWEETFSKPGLLGGGSHLAKVTKTLEYLDRLGDKNDDELVLMVDGYDIWFQLPAEVMVSRYYDIIRASDLRRRRRFGGKADHAVRSSGLEAKLANKIVFAAGKRCAPNQPHTIACYALPSSPLPDDLYGSNTDTNVGRNQYWSYRQRYLNSGYIIGPVGAMRKMFRNADRIAEDHMKFWSTGHGNPVPVMDNGSGRSAWFYHGSDQSIFAQLWGRQEYIREVLRRRFDSAAGLEGDRHRSNTIEGTLIDDILDPSFPHEAWNEDKITNPLPFMVAHKDHAGPWVTGPSQLLDQYDFGITMDYFSDLGHQTINSEVDATWLNHSLPIPPQVREQAPRGPFDCAMPSSQRTQHRLLSDPAATLPIMSDFAATHHPSQTFASNASAHDRNARSPNPWLKTSLYTHICLDRIPVIIHHNGVKSARHDSWPHMSWLYEAVEPLLSGSTIYEAEGMPSPEIDLDTDSAGTKGGGDASASDKPISYGDIKHAGQSADAELQAPGFGGAWTDRGYSLSWGQICPREMILKGEVFGKKGG